MDPVRDYIKARYLSACEAVWRIFGFRVIRKSPSVIRLSIHLPLQQYGQMGRGDAASLASTLLRYFHRPQDPPEGIPDFSAVKYTDYYEEYVFEKYRGAALLPAEYLEEPSPAFPRRIVRTRTKRRPIARIQTVHPGKGEVFYLRMILLHRSARSFLDVRTWRGITYETFEAAARSMGLLDNIDEYTFTMQEAVDQMMVGSPLRFLYVVLCLEGGPSQHLLDLFQIQMAEDYVNYNRENVQEAQMMMFRDIQNLFREHGRRMQDFGLPAIGKRS